MRILFMHLQGDYPPLLDYYSEDLKALARGMISTNPPNRPNADEVGIYFKIIFNASGYYTM